MECILANKEKFLPLVNNYYPWLHLTFLFVDADLPVSVYHEISKLGKKYNYDECEKKWENIVKTQENKPKNIKPLITKMRKLGIDTKIVNVDEITFCSSVYSDDIFREIQKKYGHLLKYDNVKCCFYNIIILEFGDLLQIGEEHSRKVLQPNVEYRLIKFD